MFEQMQNIFGGVSSEHTGEFNLKINNNFGKGTIKGIALKGGISYIDFDIIFSEDVCVSLKTPDTSPIYFTYCTQGQYSHSFGNAGERQTLGKYQTGILTSKNNQENNLYFEKEQAFKTVLIVVNTTGPKSNEEMDLNYLLRHTFLKEENDSYLYIGSYNLKIAEVVKQLDAITQKGLVRNLLTEGYVHMILGLEIQQHTDDLANKNKNKSSLSEREMEAITTLSDFIETNPEKPMSIKFLCRKTGLSPRKLQEGFKMMHDTTVTDYIRDVRVKKAEYLIKNTDLNISEVVYSIGITSRSYFSKIFKQKYDCCPKHYKDQYNTIAATA